MNDWVAVSEATVATGQTPERGMVRGGSIPDFVFSYDPKAPTAIGSRDPTAADAQGNRKAPQPTYQESNEETIERSISWRFELTPAPEEEEGTAYSFGASSPGDLEIHARANAWINGSDATSKVKWELSRNPEGLFETKTDGKLARFVAQRLPEQNSSFGLRTIRASVFDGDCTCNAPDLKTLIFFPRDAKNNPEGKRPNWAYYWEQTLAGRGFKFEFVKEYALMPDELAESLTKAAARTNPYLDRVEMKEKFFARGAATCPERGEGQPADIGIDCYAVLLRHEEHHRQQLAGWWGPKMIRHAKKDGVDSDGDWVPDSVEEASQGCNPNWNFSCPGRPPWLNARSTMGLTDNEFEAYWVGWKWIPGAADKEDWAFPGKQCPE